MSTIVKKIELQNFQAIKDFSAEFTGGVFLIKGENELGKSTILKAINILLTGERDANVLRNGEKKGFAKAIIGGDGNEYEIELKFTENNSRGTLTIKDKNGLKTDNVSMLQKILSYTNFDAVEFARWSETAEGRRKQIKIVKDLMPEESRNRIDEIDKEVVSVKEQRKDANSELKVTNAAVESAKKELADVDIEKYAEPVDITALVEKQKQAAAMEEKANTARSAIKQRQQQLDDIPIQREQAKSDLETAKKAYEAAQAKYAERIKLLDEQETEYKTRKANAEKFIADYEAQPKDNCTQKLVEAQEHNRKHQIVCNVREKQAAAQEAEKKVADFNEKLETLTSERECLIKNAKLPIDGLRFNDDGLILNGIPFVAGSVSDSQIMEVAAKLVIASNPKVNVFCIGRGESLGSKRLAEIVKIANENGFQGFIEQVERGQDTLIVEEYTEN